MPLPRPRNRLRHRLIWLFGLVLLLPLAQLALSWHTLQHQAAEASSRSGDAAPPHADHCDLCLSAAALTGGALPVAGILAPAAAARHESPPERAQHFWPRLPPRAYLSRAPPPVRL